MYLNNDLGDLGLQSGFASQAGSMVASTAAKYATSYAISTFAPAAFGSYAGPIGTVIGGIVSLFMSLFGAKPKDPVFDFDFVLPEGQEPTLGYLLSILPKGMTMRNVGWGLKSQPEVKAAAFQTLFSLVRANPPGVFWITSGGLPTSTPQARKLDYAALSQKTRELAAPFSSTLANITDEAIKADITNTVLPFKLGKNYYSNLDKLNAKKTLREELGPDFNEYNIVEKQDLQKTIQRGFDRLTNELNAVFVNKAGVNILTGAVVNPMLAEKAFKPVAGSVSNVLEAGGGFLPLLLLGGLVFLSSRQG